MLTHVNDQIRYDKIKSTSKFLDAGIAMSKHHAREIELKKLGRRKYFMYCHLMTMIRCLKR